MAIVPITIGPFASVTIDGSVLFPLLTGGQRFLWECPEDYLDITGGTVQSGRQRLTIDLSLLTDGVLPSSTLDSYFNTFTNRSVILTSSNPESGHSITIPTCYITKRMAVNYNKNAPSVLPVTITAQNRDLSVSLYSRS